jgi:hypothetical protein
MDVSTELRIQEMQARRARAEYAGDLLIRAVVAIDLAIRRIASRFLTWGECGTCAAPQKRR